MILLIYPYIILVGILSLFLQFFIFRNVRKGGDLCGSYMLVVFWLLITVLLLSQSYTSYLAMLAWLNRDPSLPQISPTPGNIYQNYILAAIPSAVFLLILVISTIGYAMFSQGKRMARSIAPPC